MDIVDRAGFFRRLATTGRRLFAGGPDTAAIDAWTVRETAPWQLRRQPKADAIDHLTRFNEARAEIAVFAIKDGQVTIVPKATDPGHRTAAGRAAAYRDFFQAVVERDRLDIDTMLAMSMSDAPIPTALVPTFALQRPLGSDVLLMPDIDFLISHFYQTATYEDPLPYHEKALSAVFTGSTTGGTITMDVVRTLSLPRLRAARYFKDSPDVRFDLANIVQCDTPATADALRALGLPSQRRSWQEQFGHRFLISMDGNGATCSRVVLALKSDGVLLKYDSPHQLYYFSEMVPWRHYIPIAADAEVEAVIAMERRNPGQFRHVAEQGRAFYERYLVPGAVFDYAAALLRRYAGLFD